VPNEEHGDEGLCFRDSCSSWSGRGDLGIGFAVRGGAVRRRHSADTVNSLVAGGYTVILKRVGDAPLDECTISAVQTGHTSSGADNGLPGVCVYVKC
jgi:hypothetical protein